MTSLDRREFWRLTNRLLAEADKLGQDAWLRTIRQVAMDYLFFFLVFVLKRKDADRDWVFDRCLEVQEEPDGRIDIWAREHYKSTIITFALTIRDILRDPERTFGIFSYSRPIAKQFLRQIKFEFESNALLKLLFPDILWENPRAQAPKWDEDDGIVVKRKGNPKESTVEAWGVVEQQPTSKHFDVMIYEDVVTDKSVNTPEMIMKTTDRLATSFNLGKEGGIRRFVGTFWHYADTYTELIKRGSVIPRIYPATKDGTREGEPVMFTRATLEDKIRDMGSYIASCQLLCDPRQISNMGFKEEWLRFWPGIHYRNMNLYILCDPAHSKKKESDYTVFWVVGLGNDDNYYAVTVVRDKLNLTERANVLFSLHQQYKPKAVGYERYGAQSDTEYIVQEMNRRNYRFTLIELAGTLRKPERIERLMPLFEYGRVWLPESVVRTDYEGTQRNLIRAFIDEEYKAYPYCQHDDMLDALARVLDEKLCASFPQTERTLELAGGGRENREYNPLKALAG